MQENLNPTNDKNKKILIKSIVGLIIALITISLVMFISWAGVAGKITGFIFYFLLSMLAIYEFSTILTFQKWVKYFLPLVTFISFFSSCNEMINWFNNIDSGWTINQFVRSQYEYKFFGISGIGYLIIFVLTLVPFLFLRKYSIQRKILFFFIFYVALISIPLVAKVLLYVNVDSFIFFLILIIGPVLADTFGYFGGMIFGNKIFKNKKLAPKISPNKTIEGAIVGFLVSWLFLFLVFWFVKFDMIYINRIVLVTIVPITLPIVSIIGDLLFSFVKRMVNIKDYSNLIPGHGGILDRVDSIIVTTLIFGSLFIVV